MESASQSDKTPEHSHSRLSSLIGFVIALTTLVLPMFAIAHFSSAKIDILDQPSYRILRSRE
ncbi:MAG: hypothetical protein HC886_03915 [Leptolyngbyaceae cyanobacterium SM1_1_3]|nr:hypothetical protein [Leptolyngbyaceae cyanobacterium SM1_1_3]NJN01558.1 hypothetical protein [Leptolyngbyaceae cyanobacterium RM1_1_2]NJO09834.1 hypothetical protein [Leptolyngbyaceae cyanobacterium SL_1_1]